MAQTKEEKAKKQHERYLKYKAVGLTKVYQRRNRTKNREKRNDYMKKWHEKNKDHEKAYAEEYKKTPQRKAQHAKQHKKNYSKNKEALLKYNKEYREKNKESLKKKRQAYYEANKERISKINKRWRQNNMELVRASQRKLMKDPHRRLRHNVSSAVRLKLLNHGGKKYYASIDRILPFKIKDLIIRLESMFVEGMTWENYGKWHLDHIIPDISFNYASVHDEEFKKAWAMENLQPLWAEENMRKGSRL